MEGASAGLYVWSCRRALKPSPLHLPLLEVRPKQKKKLAQVTLSKPHRKFQTVFCRFLSTLLAQDSLRLESDGVATMTHRATFALDDATMTRIKNLATLWNVSQAEVVRRAVSIAQAPGPASSPKMEFENFLRSGNGLEAKIAEQYLEELREDRKRWRGE